MHVIPYGRQSIGDDEIAAVQKALSSDFLTCGPEVEAFEREMAARVGAKNAVVVCNATAALHLAMLATGIGRGHRVVTSPNTFLASANCATYVGATPDFADIDPVSRNLSAVALADNWKPDTKAVVAVDYAGQAADMPAIAEVAREHGAVIIEDAAHAVGGELFARGEFHRIGGHQWADITVFSFHPVKTLTTGEGGMLVTSDDRMAATARRLRTHGMERSPDRFKGFGATVGPLAERGPWVYEMQELGYNYRITDLQCALGRVQLTRLDGFLRRRREIVARYNDAFAELEWMRIPGLARPEERERTSWHLYSSWMDFAAIGRSRTSVMSALREKGVGTQVLYIPVYLQPYYRESFGYAPGYCPEAERFYAGALSLPLFPAMTDQDVEQVILAVKSLG